MTVLVDLLEIKELLGIRSGNTDFDARLMRYAETATSQIETAVSRKFDRKVHTQFFNTVQSGQYVFDFYSPTNEDGVTTQFRRQRYNLAGWPLLVAQDTPLSVWYDPTRVFAEETKIPDHELVVDPEVGTLVIGAATARTVQGLKVSYTAGFTAADGVYQNVPHDLQLACIAQTLHLYNRMNPSNVSAKSEGGQGVGSTLEFNRLGGLVPDAAALVARYRPIMTGQT